MLAGLNMSPGRTEVQQYPWQHYLGHGQCIKGRDYPSSTQHSLDHTWDTASAVWAPRIREASNWSEFSREALR